MGMHGSIWDYLLEQKWATCNVGASTKEAAGNYYAWAEVSTKSDYAYRKYKWLGYSIYDDDVYISKYRGVYEDYAGGTNNLAPDNKTTVELSDDAARKVMGGSWRMPTKAEMEELINNCTWTWTTVNGMPGYTVKSKNNGNSIFLPAGGYKSNTSHTGNKTNGHYWTSSLYVKNTDNPTNSKAWALSFSSSSKKVDGELRYYGRLIRGVYK